MQVDNEKLAIFPRYFQVETVSVCNARCVMCLTSECRREVAIMKDVVFEKIAAELSEHSDHILRVTVQAAGEPLLDGKLEKRIERLKAERLGFVAFSTNGSLMDHERSRRIIESGVDEVTFSVDGATKQTYENIRRGLNFQQVLNNIEGFIRIREMMGADTIIRIRMTAQKSNEDELEQFIEFWEERLGSSDSVYSKVIHTWGNSGKLQEIPDDYDYERLNASPCSSLWSSMVIFSDGRVPLCCCDYNANVYLGNVAEESIRNIWQGKVLEKMREQHATRGRGCMEMCRNCTVWDDQSQLAGQSQL